MNSPEAASESGSNAELSQELKALRQVLNAALLFVLVISTCLNFFVYKQVGGLKFQIANNEKQLKAVTEEFERGYKPIAGVFVQNLQTFALSHPDFAPILAKYQIPVAPAAQSSVPPVKPAGK